MGYASYLGYPQYTSGVIMPNHNIPLHNEDNDIDFLLYGLTDEEMDLWATNMALKDIS